jgi:hypothetical protein
LCIYFILSSFLSCFFHLSDLASFTGIQCRQPCCLWPYLTNRTNLLTQNTHFLLWLLCVSQLFTQRDNVLIRQFPSRKRRTGVVLAFIIPEGRRLLITIKTSLLTKPFRIRVMDRSGRSAGCVAKVVCSC